jgi:hypothetical protein
VSLVRCLVALALTLSSSLIAQERRWVPQGLTRVGGIAAEGDALLQPLKAVADDSAIYVFDNGDHQLKAFDLHGRPRWKVGRRGQGPGEFTGVTATSLSSSGDIWLYDTGNLRITVIAPDGHIRWEVRSSRLLLPGGAVPLPNGSYLAQTNSAGPFLARFDSTGAMLAALPVPPDLAGRNVLEAHVVGDRSGGYVVFSALHSDRFYLIDEGTLRVRSYRGVERMAFPKWYSSTITTARGERVEGIRPAPGNPTGAVAALVLGQTVQVLMGSVADSPFRTVDMFAVASGAYLGSYRLPVSCTTLTLATRSLVCLQLDPAPQVHVWALAPGAEPAAK